MKFENFEAEFIKQNKQLRIVLGVAVVLMVANLTLILSDKKYFVLKNSKLVSDRPLLTWVCEEAFINISKKTPIKDLTETNILNELTRTEFKVSTEEIFSVLALKDDLCRIIVHGEGKTRSFLVSFNKSSSYPFYYKLSEINETEISQSEINLTKDEK